MRKLIAGNWKMNGLEASAETLGSMINSLGSGSERAEALICPPFTLVQHFAAKAKGSALRIGAQNCHANVSGAHTGDISAEMLADAGAAYVILGHSERRADHKETDQDVSEKVEAVLRAGLVPIICVGETLADREAGRTMELVIGQLRGSLPGSLSNRDFVIAYEPVWAIGTGLTANTDQIEEVHTEIRAHLKNTFGDQGEAVRILYGGSMKPGNAADILAVANVDGGLIGGASLKADDFLAIYNQAS